MGEKWYLNTFLHEFSFLFFFDISLYLLIELKFIVRTKLLINLQPFSNLIIDEQRIMFHVLSAIVKLELPYRI